MNYQYHFCNHFKKQIKPYLRKYRSLFNDVIIALNTFDPRLAVRLKDGIYKIRLKSRDIPRGKSHAFRMIILLIIEEGLLVPVMIYFKGDQENVSKKEIAYHLAIIEAEINL